MRARSHDSVELPTLREGTVTIVPAWRAGEDDRHAALPCLRASWVIRQLERDGNRAVLMTLYGLATGADPEPQRRAPLSALVAKICAALESRRLLVLPGDNASQLPDPTAAPAPARAGASQEQKVISSLMSGRPALIYDGTRYRLVAVGASKPVSGQSDYVTLPTDEAVAVASKMAETLAKSATDRSLWAQITEAVARPGDKARIVLLKWKPAAAAPAPAVAAPPSKPAPPPVAKLSWIEIEIVFDDGTPFAGNCVVELPGGVRTEGAPDNEGLIRMENLDPGSCKVSFPDLDAAVWNVA